ncbi:MAG: hypothetical protein HW403_307 [Dehalococcoidia bacterium]|nr:hypothetical protein [Dehalococcoidia bacterium]
MLEPRYLWADYCEYLLRSMSRRVSKQEFFFEGIENPNGTIFPDGLIDHVMPFLTPSEWKVCTYIIRRTFGWKKESDDISLDQICNGIVKRDGVHLDYGTQLDKKTTIRALRGLESKGVITTKRNFSSHKGFEATTYSLRFRGQAPTSNLVSNITKDAPILEEKQDKPSRVDSCHSLVEMIPDPWGSDTPLLVDEIHKQPTFQTLTSHKTDNLIIKEDNPWSVILVELRRKMTRASFVTWLQRTKYISHDEGTIIVGVPSAAEKEWLEKRLLSVVRKTASGLLRQEVEVRFVIVPSGGAGMETAQVEGL